MAGKFGGNFGREKGGKRKEEEKEEEREKKGTEKGKTGREIVKLKIWKGKGMKMSRGLFFFFCLSLFETSEICLECTKMEMSTGKKSGNEKNF